MELFTEEDRWRLERSSAWKVDAARVEALCRLFGDADPMGCCYFGMNPKAWTEYLVEVEAVLGELDDCQTTSQVQVLLERVFAHYFEPCWQDYDWSRLAEPVHALRRGRVEPA